jgi:hypothetical protein
MGESEQNSGWRFGFWAIAFLILIVGFIVAVQVANKPGPRTSPANACINNLRQIDAAANQFAFEHGKTNGDAINFPNDLTNYIKLNRYGKIPGCPSGGTYTLKKVGDMPTCSLSNAVPPHVLPQ